MRILAIETSCDETAAALTDFLGSKSSPRVRVLSHIVSSQANLHAKFGGVVPNLAKREHQENLVPILLQILNESKVKNSKLKTQSSKLQLKTQNLEKILEREPELLRQFKTYAAPLPPPDIDAIVVTHGPGLAPALWVGVSFAKALAYLWDKPLIPVNHMAGHLFSALLQQSREKSLQPKTYNLKPIKFPAVALLVSGGHTQLVFVKKPWKFQVIGETLDDAAGEAFDKVARILGLGYPGGPAVSALAETAKFKYLNIETLKRLRLPRPMIGTKDFNFSFSGLKTAVLYLVRDLCQTGFGTKEVLPKKIKAAIAASFEQAVVDVLVKKTLRAAKEYRAKTVLLGGGVAANKKLRDELKQVLQKEIPNSYFLIPNSSLCGDNALMIAAAAYFTGKKIGWNRVQADANVHLL